MAKRKVSKEARENMKRAQQARRTREKIETRHAVYKTVATYRGELAGRCGVIPRHAEVSLPPEQHKQAEADGLVFVRWAGER